MGIESVCATALKEKVRRISDTNMRLCTTEIFYSSPALLYFVEKGALELDRDGKYKFAYNFGH